jgi:hypothetical protein
MEKKILELLPTITIKNMVPENAPKIVFGNIETMSQMDEILQIQYYQTVGGDKYCIKFIYPAGTSTYAYCDTKEECAENATEAVNSYLGKTPSNLKKHFIDVSKLEWYVEVNPKATIKDLFLKHTRST